jgi:shikimate kinase
MGSGKTTLGQMLASRTGAAFLDLDALVEARAGTSVGEIFRLHGEARFRALELEALAAIAAAPPPRAVLAAGGGIVETAAAGPLLHKFGTVVWLEADPEACVARIEAAGTKGARPLLGQETDWRQRWERRRQDYERLADHVVSTHPQSAAESLAQLAALVGAAEA